MYTCYGRYDYAVEWVSLDPELLPESKMDATWNTPQSLHNSSGGELFFMVSVVGVDAIFIIDGVISAVDEDAIRDEEVGAISVVHENATPDRLAGARVEGRKTPHLLR